LDFDVAFGLNLSFVGVFVTDSTSDLDDDREKIPVFCIYHPICPCFAWIDTAPPTYRVARIW
jgi:hypothetical protein